MCTDTLALTRLLRLYLKCIESAVGSKSQAAADFGLMPLEATGDRGDKNVGFKSVLLTGLDTPPLMTAPLSTQVALTES